MRKKNFYKVLSVIIILIVIVVVNYFEPSSDEITKSAYESLKYEKFYGEVQEKFYDRKNHNHPTIILRNEFGMQDVLLVRDRSGLFNYIESGDSISKIYGKYEVRLKRIGIDTVFVLSYQ
ncbi:hypothetical protein ACT3CE_13615 [Marinifilum sp. RC60d5]|uniref:hypothetical protein n=1 Tax=Marinifilum sp. RC60d5 TaxID=3458414 RepID=UPI004035AACA